MGDFRLTSVNHHVHMYACTSTVSEPQQQLYVRLFLRKHHWIRASKLSYKDIAANLQHVIDGLVAAQFVMNGKPDF